MSETKCECKQCEQAGVDVRVPKSNDPAEAADTAYKAFAQAVGTLTSKTAAYRGYTWAWPPCSCYRCPHCGGYPYAPYYPRWEIWC